MPMQFVVVESVAPTPAVGEEWQNITRSFIVTNDADGNVRRFQTVQLEILGAIQQQFIQKAGPDANPDLWALVVMKDWWMKQTSIRTPFGAAAVFVDCWYALVPKSKLEAPDDATV